jgi:hypothetical protein
MSKIVLLAFGVLYFVLGVWCFSSPQETARKIGFDLVGGAGRSEFMTVYGGLEIALGVFLLICGMNAGLHHAGLLFALISSACLMLARVATLVVVEGVSRTTWLFFATEVVMTLVAALAFGMHVRRG